MAPQLPTRPQPDLRALARGQADLLANLSRLQPADEPTEAEHPGLPAAPLDLTHAPWQGTQAAWEAAGEASVARRYRFAEVFARGGLGAVRRAEDRKLGRTIAVKELLRFDAAAVQRFAREAAITARLQHPGIIPLHDLGRDELGRPFLCMKLVEGGSLEQRIAACPDFTARLALLPHVIAAADAMAYAHSHCIVHRDLKPANILVGEFGEAVVIDWGLAKDLSQGPDPEAAAGPDPDTISDVTAAGSLLGTIRYMPPEQARGEPVDARSDVYALGAVLYHLLAGVAPYHDLRSAELLHAVLTGRPASLAHLAPAAPRALAAIVARAMEPAPAARYASAGAFAADLRRFVAGRLVDAHDYSLGELGRLWLRRHRGVASVAAASVVLLAGLGGLAFARVDAERDRAEAALHTAESALATAESDRGVAEQRAAQARAAQALADRSADDLRLQQARSLLIDAPAAAIHELARLGPDPANDAPARLLALAAEARDLPERLLHGPRSNLLDVLALADGTVLAREHSGKLWRWSPGAIAGELLADDGMLVTSPGGKHWARITRDTVELHRDGAPAQTISAPRARVPMWPNWRLSDDGRTLVGAPAVLIDLSLGTVEDLTGPGAPPAIARSEWFAPAPDGRRVAAIRDRKQLVLWDRDAGTVRTYPLPAPVHTLPELGPDGRSLLVHCKHGRILVLAPDGAPRTLTARLAAIAGPHLIALSPDGMRLWAEPLAGGPALWTRELPEPARPEALDPLVANSSGLVRLHLGRRWEVFEAATGTVRHSRPGTWRDPLWLGPGPQIYAAVPGSPGTTPADPTSESTPGEDTVHRIATIDLSRSAWTRLAPPAPGGLAPPATNGFARMALSTNGRHAVRQHRDHRLERLDLGRGHATTLPPGCGAWVSEPIAGIHIADDGRVLLADNHGQACLWQGDSVHPLVLADTWLHAVSFAPDGHGFAITTADSVVSRWDRPDGPAHQLPGTGLYYSPDGASQLLLDPAAPRLYLQGRDAVVLAGSEGHVRNVAYAPDSRLLAQHVRDDDGDEVLIVDARTGDQLRRLSAPPPIDRAVTGQVLRFSASGQALALSEGDRIYRWSLTGPDEPAIHDRITAYDLAFTPDEQALIVLDDTGALHLLDPVTGTQAPLRDAPADAASPRLAATPDGIVLLTPTGEVLQWRDTLPTDPDELRRWLSSGPAARRVGAWLRYCGARLNLAEVAQIAWKATL